VWEIRLKAEALALLPNPVEEKRGRRGTGRSFTTSSTPTTSAGTGTTSDLVGSGEGVL
jgi:hypothetical protein